MPAIEDMIKLFQSQGLDEDTAFLYASAMTEPSMSNSPYRREAQNALSHSLSGRFTSDTPMVPKLKMVRKHTLDENGEGMSGFEVLPEPAGINRTWSPELTGFKRGPQTIPIKYTPEQLAKIKARQENPLDPSGLSPAVVGSGWPGSAEWPTVPYAVDAQRKKMLGDREKVSAAKMLTDYIQAQDKLRAAEASNRAGREHNAYLAAQGNGLYAARANPALLDNPNPWGQSSPDQYLRDVGLSPVQALTRK